MIFVYKFNNSITTYNNYIISNNYHYKTYTINRLYNVLYQDLNIYNKLQSPNLAYAMQYIYSTSEVQDDQNRSEL